MIKDFDKMRLLRISVFFLICVLVVYTFLKIGLLHLSYKICRHRVLCCCIILLMSMRSVAITPFLFLILLICIFFLFSLVFMTKALSVLFILEWIGLWYYWFSLLFIFQFSWFLLKIFINLFSSHFFGFKLLFFSN